MYKLFVLTFAKFGVLIGQRSRVYHSEHLLSASTKFLEFCVKIIIGFPLSIVKFDALHSYQINSTMHKTHEST